MPQSPCEFSFRFLSFKDILFETSAEIKKLFDFGYTPGLAFREYWRLAKLKAINDVELHKMMADRSLFPRRIDFDTLYTTDQSMRQARNIYASVNILIF